MTYVAGEITVPAGGGPVTVDTPADAVVFFGTNFTAVDTIVTTTGTGIFMGWAGPDILNPTSAIRQGAISIVPDGKAYVADEAAILCADSSATGTTLYRAMVTDLGNETFTVDFTQGASGGYKVYYLAISELDHCVATGHTGSQTVNVGWKALSVLGQSYFGPQTPPDSSQGRNTGTWGGSCHAFSTPTWGWLAAHSFPTSQSGQGISETFASSGGTPRCGVPVHFTGPFMITGLLNGRPTGTGGLSLITGTDPANYGWWLAWEGASQWRGLSIPASAVDSEVATTFTQLEGVEALITFTSSDAPQGQAGNAGGAAGFSFATEGFQCCAIVDAMGSRGAFQSNTKGWASQVDGTQVRAGEVEFDGNQAILRTLDGGAINGSLVGMGFQVEEEIPGFFRRLGG